MTDQDQMIEIAKLDGWEFPTVDVLNANCIATRITKSGRTVKSEGLNHLSELKYLTSRDAIVPVIEKQNMTVKDTVHGYLFEIVGRGNHVFLATPSQLCEALLRVTGKWKD